MDQPLKSHSIIIAIAIVFLVVSNCVTAIYKVMDVYIGRQTQAIIIANGIKLDRSLASIIELTKHVVTQHDRQRTMSVLLCLDTAANRAARKKCLDNAEP